MQLNDISNANPKRRRKVRIGRGPSSGLGKTCGRGQKGLFSRAGASMPAWFEGGTMPLVRRVPKRGFSNAPFKKHYVPVNLGTLAERFKAGEQVDPEALRARRIVSAMRDGIKILGRGKLDKALSVKAHAFSKAAARQIVQAGGTVEELTSGGHLGG